MADPRPRYFELPARLWGPGVAEAMLRQIERGPGAVDGRDGARPAGSVEIQNPPCAGELLHGLKPHVEKEVHRLLYPMFTLVRDSRRGAAVERQWDRAGPDWVVTICLRADAVWPLEVRQKGAWHKLVPRGGRAVLTPGRWCAHRRSDYPGERDVTLSLHYSEDSRYANGHKPSGTQPAYIHWPGALSAGEIDRFYETLGDGALLKGVVSASNKRRSDFRSNRVRFLKRRSRKWAWLYERVRGYAEQIARDVYGGIDIGGPGERMQFARYRKGERYKVHIDMSRDSDEAPGFRSLSCVIGLKQAEKGGGTSFPRAGAVDPAPGDLLIFTADEPHEALPVVEGYRDTLVVWFGRRTYKEMNG